MSSPILRRFICELPIENVIVLPDAERVHEDDKIKKRSRQPSKGYNFKCDRDDCKMKVKQWKNIDGLVTHIANFHPQDGMILKTYTCKLHRKPIVKCSPISWHYHKIGHRSIANLNDSPKVKIVTKKWSSGTWSQTKEQAHTMEEICHWNKNH